MSECLEIACVTPADYGRLVKLVGERDRLKEAIYAAIQECHDFHATANSVESILTKAVIY